MSVGRKFDTFRYYFSPVEGKYKDMREQWLHGHSYISKQMVVFWEDMLESERQAHRWSIGKALTEAIHEGWFPDSIDWYEGEPDWGRDWYEYQKQSGTVDEYHFYTKVHLVAPDAYALMERKQKPFGGEVSPFEDVRMQQWRPKDLK